MHPVRVYSRIRFMKRQKFVHNIADLTIHIKDIVHFFQSSCRGKQEKVEADVLTGANIYLWPYRDQLFTFDRA